MGAARRASLVAVDEEDRRTSLAAEGQEEGHSRRLVGASGRSSRRCMGRQYRRELGSRSSCFHCGDQSELVEGGRHMGSVDCARRCGGWCGWDNCSASKEAVSVLYSYRAKGAERRVRAKTGLLSGHCELANGSRMTRSVGGYLSHLRDSSNDERKSVYLMLRHEVVSPSKL